MENPTEKIIEEIKDMMQTASFATLEFVFYYLLGEKNSK